MTLSEALDRADRALREVCDATEVEWVVVDNKTQLVLEYFSTALEHQSAIILLVRAKHRGSALALVRSVYEIIYRAMWVMSCAKPEDVEKIKKDTFAFPGMGTLVAEIDAALTTSFFSNIKKLGWNIQNAFTHTGRSQRIGRVKSSSTEWVDYPEKGMILQVDCAMQMLIIFAIFLVKSHGYKEAAARLDKLAEIFVTER